MKDLIGWLVTLACAILGSAGLWTYLGKRSNHNSALEHMVRGLAHDRIMYLGMKYIERGRITVDELENLRVYLYEPYAELHGNGSAARIMQEVDKLPIERTIQNEYNYHNDNNE